MIEWVHQETIYKRETFSLHTLCGSEASQLRHSPIRAGRNLWIIAHQIDVSRKIACPKLRHVSCLFFQQFYYHPIPYWWQFKHPQTINIPLQKQNFSTPINSQFRKLQIPFHPQLELLNSTEKTKLNSPNNRSSFTIQNKDTKCIRRQLVSTNRELSRFYYLPRK